MRQPSEQERNLFRRDIQPRTEIDIKTDLLVNTALQDALEKLPERAGVDAQERVKNAIEARFRPYVLESETIAAQIGTPQYKSFVAHTKDFLDTSVGIIACPDGRIAPVSLTDPRVGRLHRRLQGMPEFKQSAYFNVRDEKNVYIVDDPMINAAISTTIGEKRSLDKGKIPDILELIGPHIHSGHPEHGCGAGAKEVSKNGRPVINAMKLGAVPEYFNKTINSFDTFNHAIKRAGGNGYTVDMTHDAFSQGLIFGLNGTQIDLGRSDGLNLNQSLRDNLIRLHKNKHIVMTELLDPLLQEQIAEEAAQRNIHTPLQIRNPDYFAQNMIHIGEIARKITQTDEEQTNFSWFSYGLDHAMPDNVRRTLAYHAIRNSVYRQLGGIQPGDHDLLHHPEQIIRIGPIGADFNVGTIPFTEVTPHGLLRQQDTAGADALYGLSEGILPTLGVDLSQEARVIVVTGEYNEADYSNATAAQKAFHQVANDVSINVHTLSEKLAEGVANGETVIIGALHDSATREMTHVLPTAA